MNNVLVRGHAEVWTYKARLARLKALQADLRAWREEEPEELDKFFALTDDARAYGTEDE